MTKINRIKTHIPGFDELIEGGFPEGSINLISGDAGTGKTIFSLQYLYNCTNINKENTIYFTFEEKKESLLAQAKQFGWDLEKLENKKKGGLKIIPIGYEEISKNTADDIIEIIKNTKTKNIIIDSITTLSFLIPKTPQTYTCEENEVKKFLYLFLTKLKKITDLTSIIISQKNSTEINDLAKYICDGAIEIKYESLGGDYSRTLIIRKMRKTKNNDDLHPLEISSQGIKIHKLE